MKGLFITFEGGEGCGKTTQAKKLADYLKQKRIDVVLTQEPGGTVISDKIKEILLSPENKNMEPLTELSLYTASRAQHVKEKIEPALSKGKYVICDRFADSTIAYQCFGRRLARVLVDNFNRQSAQGVKPDLTFIIDVPIETGLCRAKKVKSKFSKSGTGDRLEQEKVDFHMRVYNGYKKIALRNPRRVKVINGSKSESEVFNEIVNELERKLSEIQSMVV